MDANQAEIVAALRRLGWSVAVLSSVGDGFPDVLVGAAGVNVLLEIKDGQKTKSAQKLTEAEVRFHEEWRGQATVVNSLDSAIEAVSTAIRARGAQGVSWWNREGEGHARHWDDQ